MMKPMMGALGSRNSVNMMASQESLCNRRRSSHDDNQIAHGIGGNLLWADIGIDIEVISIWFTLQKLVLNSLPSSIGCAALKMPDHAMNESLKHLKHVEAIREDSQRYEAKRLEVETWLCCMENRANRMGPVATTIDFLEAQQKEQKVRL